VLGVPTADRELFRPLTITQKLRLLPGQELIEYFCSDNEKDQQRYVTMK
jgi:hypothetical protein